MNTVEEFTFPIINNNNTGSNNVVHVSTAVLPPLWRIPSINNEAAVHGRRITKILTTFVSSSHELPQAQAQAQGEIINYNSGDHASASNNNNSAAEEVEDENNIVVAAKSEEAAAAELEKMDVLWEDFNEELLLQSSSNTGSSISESHIDHHLHSNNNYYTYGGELFDKINGNESSVEKSTKRRKNLELVFKMFKKVFLLPNNNIAATTVKKTGHIS
ncbi:hypothetical protein ABFS83_08G245200 [Erythranthe nasuta]